MCGSVSTAFSVNFPFMLVLRGILGLGVGLIGVVCPLYVSEMASEEHEEKVGFLGTLFQLAITIGINISFLLGLLIKIDDVLSSEIRWRILIGAGILPGFFLLIIGIVIPESKIWLREIGSEQNYAMINETKNEKSCFSIFSRRNAKSLLTGALLAACLQLTGINVIMFFGPDVLKSVLGKNKSDSDSATILFLNLVIGVWNTITTLIAVGLVDKFGRKRLIMTGTIILTAANILSGVASQLDENLKLIFIGIGLALFLLGFESGIGCLFWVLVNEVFEQDVREQSTGFVNLLQWGFNLLVLVTYPHLDSFLGAQWPFYIYGGIGILVIIGLYKLLPGNSEIKEMDYDQI